MADAKNTPIPTRTRTEDAVNGPWKCGHCNGMHWRGNICACAGFSATRNLPEPSGLELDAVELIW
jgi:hypothetical protein